MAQISFVTRDKWHGFPSRSLVNGTSEWAPLSLNTNTVICQWRRGWHLVRGSARRFVLFTLCFAGEDVVIDSSCLSGGSHFIQIPLRLGSDGFTSWKLDYSQLHHWRRWDVMDKTRMRFFSTELFMSMSRQRKR